jgi:HAD superfamily hydrolase (TIGR01549 family)
MAFNLLKKLNNPMSILEKYGLFIFDWDNTLSSSTAPVNAMQFLKKDFSLMYAKAHPEKYTKEAKIGNIQLMEDEHSFYSALYDCYTYFFRPGMKKDALKVLKYLKGKKKKVAVFSDAKKYRLYTETRKSGATEYIDLELSSEAIKYYKPHPAGLLLIIDRFRVGRKKTLYIGDAASDILTAHFAGVDACGIADGIETYEGLKAAKAKYVFKNLDAFMEALRPPR